MIAKVVTLVVTFKSSVNFRGRGGTACLVIAMGTCGIHEKENWDFGVLECYWFAFSVVRLS